MISGLLTVCLGAYSWISIIPSVLLLGEAPMPREEDYE